MKQNTLSNIKNTVIGLLPFYLLASLPFMATSCFDNGDWDEPSKEVGMEAYGNLMIQETNVKTIAELKELFKNEIDNNGLREVKEPMQIKGVVIGNEEGGNIYNSIYILDPTGAIGISLAQSGLHGAFSVGQCILIELEGLYIGGYGKQPQIGTTYTNPNKVDATPQVGRMSRYIWQEHYKLLPPIDGFITAPIEVKWNFNSLDLAKDCAKLVKLKGVELSEADGTAVFAPSDGSVTLTANCANRVIKGLSNVVLRTSTYANFANQAMPTGLVDITGIATRYNDTWQILMRTVYDIEASSTDPAPTAEPAGKGTKDDPYNVAGVAAFTKGLPADQQSSSDVYAKGFIVTVSEIDLTGTYGNATYLISDYDDGATGTFQIYRGYGLNGQKFNAPGATIIKAGDEVVIKGKVVNYRGNTPQFAQGSTIVSIKQK